MWDRLRCGGMYGVSLRQSTFGVCAQEFSGDDGRKLCPLTAMDFIGPLPLDNGCDYLLTITDRLGSDLHFVPTTKNVTAEKLAVLFFDNWYCENRLPRETISDRDKLFISKFWKHLMLLTGIKSKMSTAYHPPDRWGKRVDKQDR